MRLFTPEDRTILRAALLERASGDERISGGAITGSAAESREDRWSDIDLAFGIRDAAQLPATLTDWTAYVQSASGPASLRHAGRALDLPRLSAAKHASG